jgi:hypothetical protein
MAFKLFCGGAAWATIQFLAFMATVHPAFRGLTVLLVVTTAAVVGLTIVNATLKGGGYYSRQGWIDAAIPYIGVYLLFLIPVFMGWLPGAAVLSREALP